MSHSFCLDSPEIMANHALAHGSIVLAIHIIPPLHVLKIFIGPKDKDKSKDIREEDGNELMKLWLASAGEANDC